MLGIIYLVLCILIGKEITSVLLSDGKADGTGFNRIWITAPASFGIGTLFLTWAVYIISWFASVKGGMEHPLFLGNLVVMAAALLFLVWLYAVRFRSHQSLWALKKETADSQRLIREAVFFGICFLFLTWIMFYTFHLSGGYLYSGYTVYGDYAPHTAMMRSFSLENNFPTQYPHFGGADVKYHFMFQFLSGNLEYLGLPIDIAYNSVSILSLLGFFMILYSLAFRIAGGMGAGILSVVFMIFRSGTAFFVFAWEHIQAGDLWEIFKANTSFIGYTTNENWGLWNFNVYLNQRHLGFGLLLVALALWVFLDWLEAGADHQEKGWKWLKCRFTTREAWLPKDPERALLMGLVLGLASFWNGAAVIGGLLILCGFALFSDGKLDYALTAGVTVLFTMIQSKIFITGSVVSPSFYFGFLADDKTLWGSLVYLFKITGPVFLGVILLLVFMKRRQRAAAVAFLMPVLFTFTISLTPDINVNHKYVMIAYAFMTIFWGWAVCGLWKKKIPGKICAILLTVSLTLTGIYDFVVILKDNDSMHRVSVNMNSTLTKWLSENLTDQDLILTPEYSMNEVTMSGVMMYLGWPYYAWSAGYDTNYRAAQAVQIYTAQDQEILEKTVAEEKITYILYEEGMEFEQQACREDLIEMTYPLVYTSDDGRIRIYQTTEEYKEKGAV